VVEPLGQPDPRERRGRGPRLGRRSPGDRIGISAFSSALNSGSRWWNWKTKRPGVAKRHARLIGHGAEVVPVDVMRPDSARSSPPSRCSSVLCRRRSRRRWRPSPALDDQIEVAEHVDVLRADAIALVERGDFDEGRFASFEPQRRHRLEARGLARVRVARAITTAAPTTTAKSPGRMTRHMRDQ
jgi:hypothetical protein